MAPGILDNKATGTGFKVLLSLACVVIIVAGLRAASELLIPIMLGMFLAVLSMPTLNWLVKKRVPRPAALGMTIGFDMLILTVLVFFAIAVIPDFQSKRSDYANLLKTRVADGTRTIDGYLKGFTDFVENFDFDIVNGDEIEPSPVSEETAIGTGEAAGGEVTTLNDETVPSITLSGLFDKYWDNKIIIEFLGQTELVGRITSLASKSFFVLIIMIFVLSESGRYNSKVRAVIRTRGPDLRRFQRSASDIQKYLAIKTAVSAATGLVAWLACSVFGVDFPALWGLVAFLFNFIPAIGSILAAIPAVALALLEHGFWIAFGVLLCYLAINIFLGNFVEPMLLGDRFGISTTMVILSVLFWGFVWGPVGMFLAIPLTMLIKVSLQTSEDLSWIAILMGKTAASSHPKLAPIDSDGAAEG